MILKTGSLSEKTSVRPKANHDTVQSVANAASCGEARGIKTRGAGRASGSKVCLYTQDPDAKGL